MAYSAERESARHLGCRVPGSRGHPPPSPARVMGGRHAFGRQGGPSLRRNSGRHQRDTATGSVTERPPAGRGGTSARMSPHRIAGFKSQGGIRNGYSQKSYRPGTQVLCARYRLPENTHYVNPAGVATRLRTPAGSAPGLADSPLLRAAPKRCRGFVSRGAGFSGLAGSAYVPSRSRVVARAEPRAAPTRSVSRLCQAAPG